MTDVRYDTETFKRDIAAQAEAQLRKIGDDLVTAIKDDMAGPKSGKVYRRRGRIHRASAPGESPAIDSRALVDSISQPRAQSPFRVVFEIGARHAELLEGTESRPGKRPFVRRAIAEVESEFNGR